MPSEIKQYAVFQKIRQPDGARAYAGFKYLHGLENARKVALFDYLSATTLIGDSEDPNEDSAASPQVEIFAGRIKFAAIIAIEQEHGNSLRLTTTAAGHKIIKLTDAQSLTAPPPLYMTDVHRLAADEYGEVRWVAGETSF
jgi:hypothetical protein